MNQQEADAFVQRLYDSIFDSLTKAEPGGKPIFSPATTIFSLAKPGWFPTVRSQTIFFKFVFAF